MEWQHPQFLYLILPLCAAWLALALYSRRRRRSAAQAFVAAAMSPRILPVDSRLRFWIKTFLREVAIVAGLVALAGPRFGTQYEDVIPRGSDLYVLIDVSRSMLASDVPPSRLGRAKADVSALVERLDGERVGLIAFAGQAVVKCPLTVDYDAFRRSLDELDPASAPRGGTAIGDAVRKALEVFHAKGERDQAILLITDGDDQQSYPLEAAAVAAERHVTIFTVGLGDADRGARVPQGADSKTYMEYEGQQVWSKLHGSLLEQMALKTSGVYVPAGTRPYDLGELYTNYLHGRRGGESGSQKRIRRSEQFQIFLALALVALLAELCVRPYRPAVQSLNSGFEPLKKSAARQESIGDREPAPRETRSQHVPLPTAMVLVLLSCLSGASCLSGVTDAGEPSADVQEGLRLYSQDEFDAARKKFAAAGEELAKEPRQNAEQAAIAAFDEACALHRKGDTDQAREQYLKAGLAHDRQLAGAAHFNLGTLAAEQARTLAGEHPETVAADKRQQILDHLKGAVASFRHCLELQPDNSRARRDIELVRSWIKYYTEKWNEQDRQKRRKESNLLEFLEFLIQTQTALRDAVKALPATAPADAYAELARAQADVQREIAPLSQKIKDDLRPKAPGGGTAPPANSKELDEGVALLQGWADEAGNKMSAAAGRLKARQAPPAAKHQQAAIDELEKIWEAVVPFQPLLARDLADQTQIAKSLEPAAAQAEPQSQSEPQIGPAPLNSKTDKSKTDKSQPEKSQADKGAKRPEPKIDGSRPDEKESEPDTTTPAKSAADSTPQVESLDLEQLAASQERTARRTQLLKLKAEAELERLEKSPQPEATRNPPKPKPGKDDDKNAGGKEPAHSQVDLEQAKAAYRKAIELTPQAVEKMQSAANALKEKDQATAFPRADAARKILEEIQNSQPKSDQSKDEKNEQKNDQKQDQEQDKKDQDKHKQEQQKQDEDQQQSKQQEQKKDEKGNDKADQEQKEKEKKDKQNNSQKGRQQTPDEAKQKEAPQQVSRDRIEEVLRKVREREQDKRERDRKLKGRVLGRVPVEKDW